MAAAQVADKEVALGAPVDLEARAAVTLREINCSGHRHHPRCGRRSMAHTARQLRLFASRFSPGTSARRCCHQPFQIRRLMRRGRNLTWPMGRATFSGVAIRLVASPQISRPWPCSSLALKNLERRPVLPPMSCSPVVAEACCTRSDPLPVQGGGLPRLSTDVPDPTTRELTQRGFPRRVPALNRRPSAGLRATACVSSRHAAPLKVLITGRAPFPRTAGRLTR